MGIKHGRYFNFAGEHFQGGAWMGDREPWQDKATREDIPLSNLFVTMLNKLGVQTDSFADSTGMFEGI